MTPFQLHLAESIQRAKESGFHFLAAGILAAFPECFPGVSIPVPTFDEVTVNRDKIQTP